MLLAYKKKKKGCIVLKVYELNIYDYMNWIHTIIWIEYMNWIYI